MARSTQVASYCSNRAAGNSAWGENQAMARRTSRLQHFLVTTAGLEPYQVRALRTQLGVSRVEDIARVTSADLEGLQISKRFRALAEAATTPASTPASTPEKHASATGHAAATALLCVDAGAAAAAARRRLPRREFPRQSAQQQQQQQQQEQEEEQPQQQPLPAKQRDFSATASPVSTPSATASPLTLPGWSGSDRSGSGRSGSDRSASERSGSDRSTPLMSTSSAASVTTPGSACVTATPGPACAAAGTPGSWPPAWMRTPGSWTGSTSQPAFAADQARSASSGSTGALRPTLCFTSGTDTAAGDLGLNTTPKQREGHDPGHDADTPGSWPGSGPALRSRALLNGAAEEGVSSSEMSGAITPGSEQRAHAQERRSASPLQSCRPGSPLLRFERHRTAAPASGVESGATSGVASDTSDVSSPTAGSPPEAGIPRCHVGMLSPKERAAAAERGGRVVLARRTERSAASAASGASAAPTTASAGVEPSSPDCRASERSQRGDRSERSARSQRSGHTEEGRSPPEETSPPALRRSASPLQSCRPGSPLQRFLRSSPSSCGEARAEVAVARSVARSEAQAEAQAEVEVARALVAMAVAPRATAAAAAAEAKSAPSWHAMLCCIAA